MNKKLNDIEYQMHRILGSLKVLENSVYRSEENEIKDKDFNVNHALRIEMIANAVEKCIEDIENYNH